MSRIEAGPPQVCGATAPGTEPELLPGVDVALGGPRGIRVTRTLPNRHRRMVGAWCFLDAYGPHDLTGSPGMNVPPHPHTGLQTVSWLLDGQILHSDGLGNHGEVRPRQLNLMTAGVGIAHSEQTPPVHTPILQGVQLWVALPGAGYGVAPDFVQHPDLPTVDAEGVTARVIMGELAGVASPARCHTPLVGAQLDLAVGAAARLKLRPDFEYAVLALTGTATVGRAPLSPGPLLYLGAGHADLGLAAPDGDACLLLLGGEPFDGRFVMWWNFIGADHDEVHAAREDWMAGRRFRPVIGYDGDPLPAPPMPTTRLTPRGRVR